MAANGEQGAMNDGSNTARPLRILLLTPYFPPEMGALAARSSEHAAAWASDGHAVEICTAFPNYPTGIIPEVYRGKLFARERRDGYTVNRSWIYAEPKRSVANRILNTLSLNVSVFFSGLLKCRRPDVIIASSPPFAGPVGYALSVLKRVPFIFEVRDILPQQAVDLGMLKNKFVIRMLTAVEEFLYRRAKAIVFVAEASRQAVVDRGFDPKKCVTIENGIQEDVFAPGPKENAVREEWGWQGKFVALYIGVHGVSQGLRTILDAAELLRDSGNVHFVFVGEGGDKSALIEYAKAKGLTNVEFLPSQPKERMPEFYAAADACVVPLRQGPYFRLNIPSKMFEIMACGRPIVLGAEGQALDLLEAAGAGLAVTPEDAHAYAEALLRLQADPELGDRLGQAGRAYAIEHCTRRRKALDYLRLIREIADGRF